MILKSANWGARKLTFMMGNDKLLKQCFDNILSLASHSFLRWEY